MYYGICKFLICDYLKKNIILWFIKVSLSLDTEGSGFEFNKSNKFYGSKYIGGSGSRILAQFESGSRVMLSIKKKWKINL